MRFLLAIAVLASTWTGFAQGTTEGQAIWGYSSTISAFANSTVGWTFQTTRTIKVTELGCFSYIFANNPTVTAMQVGLWNDSGSLLASNTVTLGSSLIGQTLYSSITPVSLDPGNIYHLGAYYSGGGIGIDIAGQVADGTITNSSAIQLRNTATASSGTGFAFPGEVAGTPNSIYAGPNLLFDVPEPTSWVLLSLGGLFLAARRGRQRV